MQASPVVAGNPALASQYNNLLLDAICLTETVTSGEAYSATTPVTIAGSNQTYSVPTLLYESGGQWFRVPASGTNGSRLRIGMAKTSSSGAAQTVQIYIPGGLVPITGGTPSTTDLGRNVTNSSTAGACELTTRPAYNMTIGYLANTSYMYFHGVFYNNTFWHQITVPVVSGAAIAVGNVITASAVTGKWVIASNNFTASYESEILIAASAASGADEIIQAYLPGSMVPGLGVSNGVPYYLGASGAVSTSIAGTFLVNLGVGYDGFLHFNPVVLNRNSTSLLQVAAGENWSVRELLYFKKSDQRFYRADADVAESGILEVPAFAFATHSGGAGSAQMVYMPGGVIRGAGFTFSPGDRLFPSGTTGAYVANTPASYDTFYRQVMNAIEGDLINFIPQQMEFLPTGIQEKGYCSAESVAGPVRAGTAVNFRTKMSNTPSSVSFSSIATTGVTSGPSALNINRFGFGFQIQNSGSGIYNWYGTYQTVGN